MTPTDSPPPRRSAIHSLDPSTLEHIFYYAGLSHVKLWLTHPDYSTLKRCALVHSTWRRPAQSILCRHIRIATPTAITAIRSREARRMIESFGNKTETLDSENLWGIDSYWLLDRIAGGDRSSLKAFGITYDPLRGESDGQAERDEEWLEWDILRHPALTSITNLCSKADFKDPADLSPITLPLTHLTFGKLPLSNGTALHKALLTSMNKTLRTISLDFSLDPVVPKPSLDDLIEHFQVTATTLEFLHFLNKPNLNFLMSLHSKMNASKMPNFYSVTYPLLPKALAPFNVLCLACINNGTSLVEFKLVEPPYDPIPSPLSSEEHEALVLRYLSAFGSRLDSFNIMGRRFRFMFPRQWSAKFVKLPETAKFIDRASARGCDVWCGNQQRFSATAKAVEKRKGKRAAKGGAIEGGEGEGGPTANELIDGILNHNNKNNPHHLPSPLAAIDNVTKGKGTAAVDTNGTVSNGEKKKKKKKVGTTTKAKGKGKLSTVSNGTSNVVDGGEVGGSGSGVGSSLEVGGIGGSGSSSSFGQGSSSSSYLVNGSSGSSSFGVVEGGSGKGKGKAKEPNVEIGGSSSSSAGGKGKGKAREESSDIEVTTSSKGKGKARA